MSYREIQDADRRLVILCLLRDSDGYNANEHLLSSALEDWGHAIGTDRLRGDIAWLTEQGLTTHRETGGVMIAQLTSRGEDVAAGKSRHPGVKRPRPGE